MPSFNGGRLGVVNTAASGGGGIYNLAEQYILKLDDRWPVGPFDEVMLSFLPAINGIANINIKNNALYLPAGNEYTITNSSDFNVTLRGHIYGAGAGNTGGYTRGEFTLASNTSIRARGGMSVPSDVYSGGGASAIYNSSNSDIALLVAGGAGGGSDNGGGAGGGISGNLGRNFSYQGDVPYYGPTPPGDLRAQGGGGGNQTQGGYGGYGGRGSGVAGKFRIGGSWPVAEPTAVGNGGSGWGTGGAGVTKPGDGRQGGGGGGWYGGGGGGASLTGASGGGGSGYISPTIINGFTTNVWSNVNVHPAAPSGTVGNYLNPGSIVIEFISA